ncbi:MAG: sugar ABC transporter permease [Chloroflexi bacterium]|nr:sugar ABC transporter permease [Chloroflexota bacterium]
MNVRPSSKIRRRLEPYLFLLPALLIMIVFVYQPVVQNLLNSFYSWSAFSTEWRFTGLDNFVRVFQDEIVFRSLLNNFWYAVISVACQVCFALVLAALIESQIISRIAGAFFRTMLFLPSVLAITIIGVMWQMMYNPSIGLINQLLTQLGLGSLKHTWLGEEGTAIFSIIGVSQWQWTGYIMILFIVAIQAVPKDLYESARIDGANNVQQFIHITVPGVRQTFLVMIIITVIGAIKVFDIVWVMTAGGPNNASQTIGSYLYRVGFRNDEMGYASALASVMFVITFILSLVQIKLGGGTQKELD